MTRMSSAPETVRPRLTEKDIGLILAALEDHATATHDIEIMHRCTELAARLTTAAEPFRKAARQAAREAL
jgi:hypothetical protein